MLDKFTYKQKAIGLIAVSFLLLLVSYQLAFQKTFELAAQCEALEEKVKLADNAPMQIANLESEKLLIEQNLGHHKVEDFQEVLLEKVSNYCEKNKLVLKAFPEPWTKEKQDYIIETNLVVVKGGFVDLLKLLYKLEQQDRIARVAGTRFKAERNLRTQQTELTVSIYLQHIKNRKHEA